jgi:hypothetical protein
VAETMPQSVMVDKPCRLCGGAAHYSFSLEVLHKHHVVYLECESCHSLQTEPPYWISDAYPNNLAAFDTGAAQRNLANLAAAYGVARVLNLKDILDYGGGDGLLCRLLRDYEINCYVNDKYAAATYAQSFAAPDFTRPGIVLAFEVFEHFENPLIDLEALFNFNPDVLITSTSIFEGQNSDWWYLTPESGQHIFFYSKAALELIADRFGYTLLICSGYILFIRADLATSVKTAVLRVLLHKVTLRVVSAVMRLLPTRGVWRDFNSLRDKKAR